jgi:membrane associated rhomboid family serine protease
MGTYNNKWQWDLLWNVEPFSRPFLVLLGLYIFSNIFMPFLRRVNHVLHMRMEINRMKK